MLISQRARSDSDIGRPSPGPSAARATPVPRASATVQARGLSIDMFHLPVPVDRPAREAVVMLVREAQHVRDLLGLPAGGDELGAGRLYVAGFIPRAALQHGRTAVPAPGHAEPRESLAQHRSLERGLRPAPASVGGDHDLRNPAGAGIGDAGNLVVSGPFQFESRRRVGDEGFDLLQEVEPVRLSARQDLRVGPGLVVAHRRLLDELQPAQEFDVHVAFPAGQQQTHRIAVSGHQPLAVLVERDHGVVQGLGERYAAAQGERVGAFGDEPLGLRIHAGLIEQGGERHPGPLGAGAKAVQRLHARLDRFPGEHRCAVASAFDEAHARHHRIARQRVEREDQGPLHQTVDRQAVPGRVDVRSPGVHDREVQAVRRERAVHQMVRSARVRSARLALGIAQRADDLFLEPRALLVGRGDSPGREAPRLVRVRLGRRVFGQGIGGHRGGERRAAGQERAALHALGLQMEHRVVLPLTATIDFPPAFLGALKAGMVPVAVNTLLMPKDYEYMLSDSRARALVVSQHLVPQFAPLIGKLPFLRHVVVSGANTQGHTAFKEVLAKGKPELAPAPTISDDPCFWLYSSGSTGMPKGTVHVHSSLILTAELYAKGVLGCRESDVVLSAAKLFFAYGLGNSLSFTLADGAAAILLAERPTPASVFKRLTESKPTIFYGVPTLYAAMLASPDFPKKGSLALRLCISAGEALPPQIAKSWKEKTGVEILDGIGSTEMLHIFLSNRPDDLRYGTTGKPVPGYELRLVDEQGSPVKRGEMGELQISGPTGAACYWNNLIKPKAFVVLKPGNSGDDALKAALQQHVKDKLAPYKYPRWIEFLPELPKTATGKIQRFKLRT